MLGKKLILIRKRYPIDLYVFNLIADTIQYVCRYGEMHPVFYIGSLDDAIRDALQTKATEVSIVATSFKICFLSFYFKKKKM